MKISGRLLSVSCFTFLQLASLFTPKIADAGSATWSVNPPSSDWNTAANWTPATIPNGLSDVATFNNSSKTTIAVSETTEVSAMIFNPGASSYTILPGPTEDRVFTLSGAGITNNSGVTQNITLPFMPGAGTVLFTNSASAGNAVVVTNLGGYVTNGVVLGGNTSFLNTSTAGSAR
ncbi:MAG: hypothetical protein H0X40_04545 [Chthoniobacterales bacterium]|nr:hypothetical protein [Chthoniobacterales bacterium]